MSDIYSDFDYRLNAINKDVKVVTNVDAINNSIRNIITTQKYSVPGNPDFGANIETALFEIIDQVTFDYIEDLINEEVRKWEDRVEIRNIDFDYDTDNGQILCKIQYIILQSDEIGSVNVKLDV